MEDKSRINLTERTIERGQWPGSKDGPFKETEDGRGQDDRRKAIAGDN